MLGWSSQHQALGVITAGRERETSLEAAMYMQDKAGFLKDRLPRSGFGSPSFFFHVKEYRGAVRHFLNQVHS